MKRRPRTAALNPSTVLTTTELAAHFRVEGRTIERWHVPSFAPGRYLWAHVLEWLDVAKTKREAA